MNTMKFTEYCKQNGIVLLKDDLKYIRRLLCNIPDEPRKRVLRNYASEWSLGMADEPNVQLKSNTGRKRANLALPKIISEVMRIKAQ